MTATVRTLSCPRPMIMNRIASPVTASSLPSASVIACSGGHHETFPSETSASRHGRCRDADAIAPGERTELSLAAGADRRGVRGGGRRRYHGAGDRALGFRSAGGVLFGGESARGPRGTWPPHARVWHSFRGS